jgi:hypothetical protein
MAYFKYLPSIEYISPLESRSSINTFIEAKNLFRRIKLSDNAFSSPYVFNKYIIQEGDRPDTVAYKYYGDSSLDWLVIFGAAIINQRTDWPLTSDELYEFASKKYGNDLTAIREYRTRRVKDSDGRIILPAGYVVNQDFTIPNPDNPTSTLNPVQGITNWEYETEQNEKKKEINLVKPSFVPSIRREVETVMKYKPGTSLYVSKNLRKTDNIKVKSP